MGRGGYAGLVRPTRLRMNGALPFAPFVERGKVRDPPAPLLHANPTPPPPLLRPAPHLCMNRVSTGVTQGQGRRPLYAPPLCSRRPLLRPLVRVRTGFVPMQGHGRHPFYTPPLHSPRHLRGHRKVCTFAPQRPGSDNDHDNADDNAPTTTATRRQQPCDGM
jgi:hypothetical protein